LVRVSRRDNWRHFVRVLSERIFKRRMLRLYLCPKHADGNTSTPLRTLLRITCRGSSTLELVQVVERHFVNILGPPVVRHGRGSAKDARSARLSRHPAPPRTAPAPPREAWAANCSSVAGRPAVRAYKSSSRGCWYIARTRITRPQPMLTRHAASVQRCTPRHDPPTGFCKLGIG
jgi:hypothetical protein